MTAKQTKKKQAVGRPKKVSDEQIALALIACNGLLSNVARRLKVSVSAISQRVSKSDFLQEVREEAEEEMLDIAENALCDLIKNSEHNDHFKSLCFFLKCKGKKRGYIEKQIILSVDDDKPLVFAREKPPNA